MPVRFLLSSSLLVLLLVAACASPAPDAPSSLLPLEDPPEGVLAVPDSARLVNDILALSADSMEGRGTGTPGEERTITYIADELAAVGVEPAGDNGSFFQPVALLGATPTPRGPLTFRQDDGSTLTAPFVDGFIGTTDLDTTTVALEGDLVFVGYGVNAPGQDWNDYKEQDLSGKVLLMFVNDPPATPDAPNRFQADTLTYFGRWTYKYEEARRQGAAGAILIHTTPTAGYGFQVLSGGATGEQIRLADPPDNPLAFRGWITEDVASQLAEASGSSLDDWFTAAASPDFTPQPLPFTADVTIDYDLRRFSGTNVVGKIAGQVRPEEAIVYTAHHDHLGIGRPDDTGDAIYNGAVDNAAGVAMVLETARAFAAAPERPDRSILFVTLSAEESGLLGADYYARNPHIPMGQTIVNINLDGANPYGRTRDIVGLGTEKSTLGEVFAAAAEAENMTVIPDPNPNQGFFFRSDQLAFARAGVPAVFVNSGRDYLGQPAGYGDAQFQDYLENRYHQPSDEYDETWQMGGILQHVRVGLRTGYHLAYSDAVPTWKPGVAFAEARGE